MLILLVTFLLTIFTNLVVAVNVGVILAILFFVHRMHESVLIEQQEPDTLQIELAAKNIAALPKDVIVYNIQGPFFFGAAEKIEHALFVTHTDPKTIIFRLKNVPFMDMTGLETFEELIAHYHKRHIAVYLCEANAIVERKLMKANILHWVAEHKVFCHIADVVKHVDPPASR